MELYIVRHGKTMWNEQGRLQGHVDIPLNEEGREAAIRLQSRLSDICFDAIYSSPLKRARETAELICGSRKIPIITDDRLLEISFGDMEGIYCDDWFDEKSPYRFFFTDPSRYQTPPNGESFEQVCQRSRDFLEQVIEPLEGKKQRVMIVAHGALNKGLMCHIQHHDISHYWGNGLQKNCECSIFRLNHKKWETIKE